MFKTKVPKNDIWIEENTTKNQNANRGGHAVLRETKCIWYLPFQPISLDLPQIWIPIGSLSSYTNGWRLNCCELYGITPWNGAFLLTKQREHLATRRVGRMEGNNLAGL